MTLIYNIIFAIYSVFYFPYLIVKGKWHDRFSARFGRFPKKWNKELEGKKSIWIHAVSVGEVHIAGNLIERLYALFPDHALVCSTVTETSNQLALEKFGDKCLIIYAPLDFSWIAHRFIDQIRPKIYISCETEIWPNLYTALFRRHVPIMQVNGRISDKAFKGYRCARFFIKKVLSCVSLFYMQSPLDAERIRQLGADGSRVLVTGNLKFDISIKPDPSIRRAVGFGPSVRLLVAGSTHPGEEQILIRAYKALLAQKDTLRLVLAPRHIERTREVAELVKKEELMPRRFSDLNGGTQLDAKDVVIMDTIGSLRDIYGMGHYVFVGKSLAVGGGQNMIEPAFLGKPTIVGPMTQNFKDAVHLLKRNNAIVEVADEKGLKNALEEFIRDDARTQDIGNAARKTIKDNQGATEKTIDGILTLLKKG